jgi:4'-phosphopantetheinyl transferase
VPLTSAEIHVWLGDYDHLLSGHEEFIYRRLLSSEERARESRFYFARDRRRHLLTRAMLRTVLSKYLPVPPEAWEFSANAYGRPNIVNAEAEQAHVTFNLSHTHSLVVLGITKARAVGVDVENVRAREAMIDIAEHYFTPSEVAALAVVPQPKQHDRFFEYWTFKESYIKARGMGLSIPLDKFSFEFSTDRSVNLTIDPQLCDHERRWQFWQFRPSSEYLVAICAERLDASSPELIIRTFAPNAMNDSIARAITRSSHDY